MALKTAYSIGGKRGNQTAAIGGKKKSGIVRKKSKAISKATQKGTGKPKQVTAYNKNKKGFKKVARGKIKSKLRDKSLKY